MKNLFLFFSFLSASFKADLEYRANFILRILTDIFWYISQILVFEVIYLHTDQLGSWELYQIRIFLGLFFIVDALYMILFHDNIERMSDRVRRGELDMLLTKPVSSQFLMSCQRISTALFGNLILALSFFVWGLFSAPHFEFTKLFWLILLIPSGLISVYSVRFCIASLALILVRAESIQFIWYQLYRLGMRPDQIYKPWLRYLIWTLLPVGLIASVPSHFLFNPLQWHLLIISIVTPVTLLTLSRWVWNKSLRYYSSASS